MTDCSDWKISALWKIPITAISGVYVAIPATDRTFSSTFQLGNHIPFVIKKAVNVLSDAPVSDILFKTSDLTWVAYNLYGGWNIYQGNISNTFATRAYKASYNRPFTNRLLHPKGQYQNFIFGAEHAMIYWLEKYGYDISYVGCSDFETISLQSQASTPLYKAILSVGHDEYWTQEIKNVHFKARKLGIHLGFFSGNEIFWKVKWNDLNSETNRDFICRKETIDIHVPLNGSNGSITADNDRNQDWTGTFIDPRYRSPDPENSLTGQLFLVNGHRNGSIDITMMDGLLRFWRNTSIAHQSQFIYKNMTTKSKQFSNYLLSFQSVGKVQNVSTSPNHRMEDQGGGSSPSSSNPIVYTTSKELLGYEYDQYVEDCYRPPGLIPMSTTRNYIHHGLMESFGASYKGSGHVLHRITLYRYIPFKTDSQNGFLLTSFQQMCQSTKASRSKRKAAPDRYSIVFGAGTIQWSWALSTCHDGPLKMTSHNVFEAPNYFPCDETTSFNQSDQVPDDRNIQQATMNLLADMKIFPNPSTQESMTPDRSSADTLLPESTITSMVTYSNKSWIHSMRSSTWSQRFKSKPRLIIEWNADAMLKIRGTSLDHGGGRVASTEISLNGGKNWWVVANGRQKWSFSYNFTRYRPSMDLNDPVHYYGIHDCHRIDSNHRPYRKDQIVNGSKGLIELQRHRLQLIEDQLLFDPYYPYFATPPSKSRRLPMKLLVMSRAVDDSGWKEDIGELAALCGTFEKSSLSLKWSNIIVEDILLIDKRH